MLPTLQPHSSPATQPWPALQRRERPHRRHRRLRLILPSTSMQRHQCCGGGALQPVDLVGGGGCFHAACVSRPRSSRRATELQCNTPVSRTGAGELQCNGHGAARRRRGCSAMGRGAARRAAELQCNTLVGGGAAVQRSVCRLRVRPPVLQRNTRRRPPVLQGNTRRRRVW